MTRNERFFQRRQAAAVLKHGILRRYPTMFATMTGRSGGRVVYLDGYAGPGRYGDGEPGSPLLAIQTAERVSGWRRTVECVFVERDPSHFADLDRCLRAEAPAGLTWHAWHGDVEDHADRALRLAGRAPLLAFLDPFGSALGYDVLTRTFLARPSTMPTEVLLNLNLEMVRRIGGLLAGTDRTPGATTTLSRLDRFFGGEEWREVFAEARRAGGARAAAHAAETAAAAYCEKVRRDTGFGAFRVPVRRRPGHEPLFLLVLFFRHDVAPWKFNEAVSHANREWREACREEDLTDLLARRPEGQDSLFGTDPVEAGLLEEQARAAEAGLEREWVEEIRGNLVALVRRHAAVPLGAHAAAVYGRTLGQARDKHVRAAWDAAAEAGLVRPRDRGIKHLERAVVQAG